MLLFLFILGIHLFLLSNLQFTAWPEMLTYPWLMIQGYKFYGDIIHPYLPLLPLTLKWFYQLYQPLVLNLKLFTWLIILFSDILIYKIAYKKFGQKIALTSLIAFIILNLTFEGNGLWFDLAGIPLILLAYYLTLLNNKKSNLWLIITIGLLVGLSILIKQVFLVFAIPLLIEHKKKITHQLLLLISIFFPLSLLFIYYLSSPEFKDFLYWGLYHGVFVQSNLSGFMILPSIKQLIIILLLLFPSIFIKDKIVIWLLASLIFIFPRFAWFHLQPAVAFLSLIFGQFFFKKKLYTSFYILFLSILFTKMMLNNWESSGTQIRFFEPPVIFARQMLVQKIPPNSMVYFYNVASQYFVNTQIFPVKPWVDNFPWYMEVPGVQERIIKGLEDVEYVVFQPFIDGNEFALGVYKPKLIDVYIKENFIISEKIQDNLYLMHRK